MPSTLLTGGLSRPRGRKRLRLEDAERVERELRALVADPLRAGRGDLEFMRFVDRQFSRVFGGDPVAQDASGRGITPHSLRADLEVFRPAARRTDLNFTGSVGNGAENRPGDVLGAQRLLSNAGTFAFAMPRERSGRMSASLDQAIRDFQAAKGLKVDGRINPNGETVLAVGATLFDDKGTDTAMEKKPSEEPGNRAKCDQLWKDYENSKLAVKDAKNSFNKSINPYNEALVKFGNLYEKRGADLNVATVKGALAALSKILKPPLFTDAEAARAILPDVLELVGLGGEISKEERNFMSNRDIIEYNLEQLNRRSAEATKLSDAFDREGCNSRDHG